ncbi:Bromodomain-containing protein [Xylaria palmicola]|nr:Bromodomain-containing protein [Xylaria palmicola]
MHEYRPESGWREPRPKTRHERRLELGDGPPATPQRIPFSDKLPLQRFLSQIQFHKQAWPFRHPVNRDEVPDYYNVITSPMDLPTVEDKLKQDLYAAPKDLVEDLQFLFGNCWQYNDAPTVYSKCAAKLEEYMWSFVKEIPEWLALLEEQ